MTPFSTPQGSSAPQPDAPLTPLTPQPAVTPASGELTPNAPVAFDIAQPATPVPSPFENAPAASEAPPLTGAATTIPPGMGAIAMMDPTVKTMTTKEALRILRELIEKGEYQQVVAGADDVLHADPENAAAQDLRAQALRFQEDPAAAKVYLAKQRTMRLWSRIGMFFAALALLAGLGVAAWQLFGDTTVPVVEDPATSSYKLSVKTDPVNAEGTAPLQVTFGLRAEVPEDVNVVFQMEDKVSHPSPFVTTFEKPGVYKVLAIATRKSDNSELDHNETTVTVHGNVQVEITVTPGKGADAAKVVFKPTVTGATGALQYLWNFGDGANDTTESPTHTYAKAGTYPVSVTITADGGDKGTANTQVVIESVTPVSSVSQPQGGAVDAVITTSPRSADGKTVTGTLPFTVLFSAGSSKSENGALASAHWDFGDSFDSDDWQTSHTFNRVGLYQVTLTVHDTAGATGTEELTVNVTGTATSIVPAGPVTAVIETDVAPSGAAPLTITFDGSASRAKSGAIKSYDWDFGDNSTLESTARVSHVFQSAGAYTVKLTVTDAAGAHASKTMTVNVA